MSKIFDFISKLAGLMLLLYGVLISGGYMIPYPYFAEATLAIILGGMVLKESEK